MTVNQTSGYDFFSLDDVMMNTPPPLRPELPDAPAYRPRPLLYLLLSIVIVTICGLAIGHWLKQKSDRYLPRVQLSPPTLVTLTPVKPARHVVDVVAEGFVRARDAIDLKTQVSGKVVRVSPHLSVGKRVAKGDVLVSIDSADYQAAISTSAAQLAQAKSDYAQAQAASRQAQRDIKSLHIKASDLALKKPQLAAAKAAVVGFEAQLAQAQTNLARTTITSPFNAIITSKNISVGEVVSSSTILAKLTATDAYTVKLLLSPRDIALVKKGSAVTFYDSVSQARYHGVISRFDSGFDDKNRTIGAYVDIKNPLDGPTPLLINTYLTAVIAGAAVANSQWIDNSDLVDDHFVWYKNTSNKLEKVSVELIYRRRQKTLVSFSKAIGHIVANPKVSFFVGQEVMTQVASEAPAPHSASELGVDDSGKHQSTTNRAQQRVS